MIRTFMSGLTLTLMGTLMTACASASPSQPVHIKALGHVDQAAVVRRLNLGQHASLQSESSLKTAHHTTKTRASQLYRNIPVYGCHVVIERDDDGNVLDVQGQVARGLDHRLNSVRPGISGEQAIDILRKHAGLPQQDAQINHKQHELYVDASNETARLVYKVSFFSTHNTHPQRPTALIDAHTGRIIKVWQGLTTQAGGIRAKDDSRDSAAAHNTGIVGPRTQKRTRGGDHQRAGHPDSDSD